MWIDIYLIDVVHVRYLTKADNLGAGGAGVLAANEMSPTAGRGYDIESLAEPLSAAFFRFLITSLHTGMK